MVGETGGGTYYSDNDTDRYSTMAPTENGNGRQGSGSVVGFRNRVKRTAGLNGNKRVPPSSKLTVDAAAAEAEHDARANGDGSTTGTSPGSTWSEGRDPTTPPGTRGHTDLRSPGAKMSPLAVNAPPTNFDDGNDPAEGDHVVIPDFITQTDRHGVASTPRSGASIQAARQMHPSGPNPNLHVEGGALVEDDDEEIEKERGMDCQPEVDACDSLLDSLRMMCCCLMPEDDNATASEANVESRSNATGPVGYSTRGHDAPLLLAEDSALRNANNPDRIKLLPELHHDDHGKKCLVLDLDETLVHSSFRAVPGADFVIPVQVSTTKLLPSLFLLCVVRLVL